MSGGPPGVEILPKSFTATSCRLAICGIANPAEGANDRCLSRAERLEIISLVAAVGMSECSALIIPMAALMKIREWSE